MKYSTLTLFGVIVLGACIGVSAAGRAVGSDPGTRRTSSTIAPAFSPSHAQASGGAHASVLDAAAATAVVREYCVTCHNDRMKSGGVTLSAFDVSQAAGEAQTAERMIRKLRLGMMPPPGAKRPDERVLSALALTLEHRVDAVAASRPNPGSRPFQRLNRTEYRRAVLDLLGIDVDVNMFLPADTISGGFDNVADAQGFSATVIEGYLRSATEVVKLALGDPTATPTEATYKVPRTMSQMRRVEGAPWGTRGGISVIHTFPADGEYSFRVMLHSVPSGRLYASAVRGEQLEVSIDGERVALLDIDFLMSEADPQGMNLFAPRTYVTAGPHRVTAAFLQRFDGPIDDILEPHEYTLADSQIGEFGFGVTSLPHVRDFSITGPFNATGLSETPSRRAVFSCRPTAPEDERPCAKSILERLARQAYRRPLTGDDLQSLLAFYDEGREGADFEAGIRLALEAILISPHFLFRVEEVPAAARAGESYRVNDIDLASRLSFFLWGAAPDTELVEAAAQGMLRTKAGLEQQVRRMLADPRAEALSTRFASQWLRLQDVDQIKPDALLFPSYDYLLAESFKRETELFFGSIVREDRSILDLLDADYTFVNERVARHYGIPNVSGPEFRRVTLGPEFAYRRGLLGQGSILMQTSVANRTSPVLRGKWVMEVLLGSPPPPPPPNVPELEEVKIENGRRLSVRERMEQHRANPACNTCHRVIDPLGLALENFDVTGAYRIKDSGQPIDASGELYDGTAIDGPAGLRAALQKHRYGFVLTFTENLMTYALGRRVDYYDMPAIRAIVRNAEKNDYRFSSFVLGIANSAAFQMSQLTKVETDAGAPR